MLPNLVYALLYIAPHPPDLSGCTPDSQRPHHYWVGGTAVAGFGLAGAASMTPPPRTASSLGGAGSRLNREDVIGIIASSGHQCALSSMTDRFVTQSAKKIHSDRLKELAFTQGQGARREQVRYSINDGWLVLPMQNTAGTFGDFVFASGSGNAIRRLIGLSRVDLLMRNISDELGVDDGKLLFQEFENRTVPLATMSSQTNMLPYILLSTTLLDHAVAMAASPSIIDRLGDADSMTTQDRVEALVMASAAARQVQATTGIRLPNLSNLVRDAASRVNGMEYFNIIMRNVIHAFDGIARVVEVPGDAAARASIDEAIGQITVSYQALYKEESNAEVDGVPGAVLDDTELTSQYAIADSIDLH